MTCRARRRHDGAHAYTGRWAALLPLCIALLLSAVTVPAAAADDTGPSFVLRAGRVLPVTKDGPWSYEPGIVIVRNGRIEAVGGDDLAVPHDLTVIDLPDATVMPGMVNAMTTLAGNHGGDPSISAAYRAVDAFDRFASHAATLANGVTTVHLNPGMHRLMSGRGAVVRLGGPADQRVLQTASDLTVNLGDGASNPPDIQELLVPPASDQAIQQPRPQRPTTRMTQVLALKDAIDRATTRAADDHNTDDRDEFNPHRAALAEAWNDTRLPLRVYAQRSVDLRTAAAFLRAHDRPGYLVGGVEAAEVVDHVAAAGVPLVYTVAASFRQPGGDLGDDPTAIDPDIRDLVNLRQLRLALATAPGAPVGDLRLAAAFARRSGLEPQRIIEAITRVPAEILGVADRVGSLAPGRDADLLVLTGDPLETSSHVHRVYIGGRVVYRVSAGSGGSGLAAGASGRTVVVRAGTIWLGPNEYLRDGAVLIESGRIAEVGQRVSHPPHAQVIDAGPDAFVTPGLIDARGHLGLRGDRRATSPELSLSRLVGAPDLSELRVARAGVTSVLVTPYSLASQGSQVSAIKTWGRGRGDRVLRETAAVAMDVSNLDPSVVGGRLRGRLQQAQRYLDLWKKYEQELEEWKKKQAEGETVDVEPETVEESVVTRETDPLSGIWEGRVFGGPLPEPATGRVAIQLTGNTFEGQLQNLPEPIDHRIVGTLNGRSFSGRVEIDTGGMGDLTFQGELTGEDQGSGTISIMNFTINFDGARVERNADVQIVTRRRRTRDEDGRPVPPVVDESLEPLRAVLERRIPLAVQVQTAPQIKAVLEALTEPFDVPFVLVGADDALVHAETLVERGIGVILPSSVLQRTSGSAAAGGQQWWHPGMAFSRAGVNIAFQSASEDGARTLPQVGVYAVERGMSAERALAAMTVEPARMFKLDDRIGAIAPGRDGDLVIFSGHPFEAGSTIRRILINGEDLLP